MNYGFLIDNSRCIGCHACSTACKSENEVPLGVFRTWVKQVEVGRFPEVRRTFQVTRCNHCANPPCVRICPTAAMHRRPDGIVDFDSDACIGCKGCTQACPYDAIHMNPESHTAAKCHFCAHRVDVGLEPACVVVCPEHAILAGDLDDPASEIARVLARSDAVVRKPEQGTAPKLFYVDGNDAAMHPTASCAGESYASSDVVVAGPAGSGHGPIAAAMIRTAYGVHHDVQWHWPIPAYLVTKHVAGGTFLVLAVTALIGLPWPPELMAVAGGLAVLMTVATLALLVYDLDRPDRFFYLFLRPQWRSWIARAAWVLTAFSLVTGGWWALETATWLGLVPVGPADAVRLGLAALSAPLALLASTYTAFLFAQAEGRDLWQGAHLPALMTFHGILLGALTLLAAGAIVSLPAPFVLALQVAAVGAGLASLLTTLSADLWVPHPSEVATRARAILTTGEYRVPWMLGVALGSFVPVALLPFPVAAFACCMVGLFLYGYAFVMAAQQVPNS